MHAHKDVFHSIFTGSWVTDTLRLYAKSMKYRYVDGITAIEKLSICNK
jgi:hypothetical protein